MCVFLGPTVLQCMSIGAEPIKKRQYFSFADGTQVYIGVLASVDRALVTTMADVIRQSQILRSQQVAHACF